MNRVPPPVADTLSFTPERSLLQPKFESYKLALPTSSSHTQSYPLPTPFATRPLSDGARLSFAETQARARHNHLGHGERGELIWVERDGKVKAARLDRTVCRRPTLLSDVHRAADWQSETTDSGAFILRRLPTPLPLFDRRSRPRTCVSRSNRSHLLSVARIGRYLHPLPPRHRSLYPTGSPHFDFHYLLVFAFHESTSSSSPCRSLADRP